MDHTALLIKNVTVFLENTRIPNGSLVIEKGKISEIYQENEKPKRYPSQFKIIDGEGLYAVPGFIDGHIHGANGADVMDGTEEALDTIAEVLPKEGTTSFLATTITQAEEQIEQALRTVADYQPKENCAEIIGIHLEGPFIEESKKGAQPLEHISRPDSALFDKWQKLSNHMIKTITMAPELDPEGSFIRHLANQGVNISAGHTAIDFKGMKEAVSNGVKQVTHLCNAMTGIHHRDIGVVGAAFLLEEIRAELIADGIHVVPEMLEVIYQNMGSDRIILITDAMRAKCLHAGTYELGGQTVLVDEQRAVLEDGTLAGSILKMNHGVKQMLNIQDVCVEDVIKMTSTNPAKQLGVYDRKGSIAKGKDADILLIDENFTINYTLCRGKIAYKGDE
ncbi:N-acetylglucosamine-6-phosphate deacetylase [Ornithinibacillus sp. BX22]|uniref:N-acetylglucosamine-6-phosphate deacetylase n=2 Tax=Ornithinibacillus TaxID=484508 RepID=A0A923RLA3_9BACI|nr:MULTISPECIES: N-acetylglucosamine-6-phosphate deacetylase [Ornithinibacillus]MBC5637912.1 N-acetylglucosamine-6-phosphate deacetylase [Ornithinibacillus hominis]MBS3681724.1 N-acetylglucosamine-6-phosphate deacetylase [Ornithinibacillus massiliensis]